MEEGPSTFVVAVKQDIYRFTLVKEEGGREGKVEGEGGGKAGYRLVKGGPDRVFSSPPSRPPSSPPSRPRAGIAAAAGKEEKMMAMVGGQEEREEEEDDEVNNIVGVTLTEDGTVVVASKVREGRREGGRTSPRRGICTTNAVMPCGLCFPPSLVPSLPPPPPLSNLRQGGNVTALRADSSSFSSSSSGANFGMGTLTPVSYLPLSHFVASPSPIHISNSIAVHKQVRKNEAHPPSLPPSPPSLFVRSLTFEERHFDLPSPTIFPPSLLLSSLSSLPLRASTSSRKRRWLALTSILQRPAWISDGRVAMVEKGCR